MKKKMTREEAGRKGGKKWLENEARNFTERSVGKAAKK